MGLKCLALIFLFLHFSEGTSVMEHILKLNLNEATDEINGSAVNLTESCRNELLITRNAYENKEIWAVKLIDASGRIQPGFVWGQNFWVSPRELCDVLFNNYTLSVSSRYQRRNHIKIPQEKPPFSVNYKVIYVQHASIYQFDARIYDKNVLHVGACFPKACTLDDAMTLTDEILKVNLNAEYEMIGENYTVLAAKVIQAEEIATRNVFFILLSIGLSSLVSLIIISTIYGKYYRKRFWHDYVLTHSNAIVIEANGKIAADAKTKHRNNFLDDFLMSFSIIENYNRFTSTKLNETNISVIHGLRGIGMIWIILAHIYYFSFGTMDNMQLGLNFQHQFIAQPFLNAATLVDSFFAMSGFLLAYTFLSHIKKEKEKGRSPNLGKLLFKSILLRYLRFAIPYIPTILIATSLAYYLRGASYYHFLEPLDQNCSQYWWRNFLFINNWWPMSEMCIVPSWYLAVDFQCFLVSIILLVISIKYPKTAVTLFVAVFVGCAGYSGYVGWRDEFSFSLDVQFNTLETLYFPTTIRIGGYFAGVAVGWIFFNMPDEVHFNKYLVTLGWIVSVVIHLSIFFGQTFRLEDQYLGMLFKTICHPLWAMTVLWVIVMCSKGYGGVVTKILSAESLIKYSRLAFAAYLVNPILIFYVSMISDVPYHLEIVSSTIVGLGYLYVIYELATLFTLLFEYPFVQLIKKIVERIEKTDSNDSVDV